MSNFLNVLQDIGKTLANGGPPSYTGVTLHTSTQAIPIPILWGTRKISPNLLWWSTHSYDTAFVGSAPWLAQIFGPDTVNGNGYTNPIGSSTLFSTGATYGPISIFHGHFDGIKFGLDQNKNSTNTWWAPMIMGLCEGPIDNVSQVYSGGSAKPSPMLFSAGSGGVDQDNYDNTVSTPSLFYTIFYGDNTQNPWGFFAAADSMGSVIYGSQALAYRNTAYLCSAIVNVGHNYTPPSQSFEVSRFLVAAHWGTVATQKLDSHGGRFDYTPWHFVQDLLTSPQYGLGLSSADFDVATLAIYLNYCAAQGLYMSPLLDSQSPGVDIINRWALETNTWIFWSGTALMFAVLGDEALAANGATYTPDATPVYNLGAGDFGDPGVTVERADPVDCYNRLCVEFTDRVNHYARSLVEWKDTTLINLYGVLDASSVNCEDICDDAVAAIVVELLGKRAAYIRNRYSFTLPYRYVRILPGTIVTLTDANLGLSLLPVRVMKIEEDGQMRLAVVAEEYPGSLGISRPAAVQAWGAATGVVGGTAGSGGGGTASVGTPTATSGGGLTQTSVMNLVLFVAGDVITLPLGMTVGAQYVYKHDQLRSPQPTPALLESNPVKFQIPTFPSGATYLLEDPSDGTLAAAASVFLTRPSGTTLTLVNTGDGIVRCLQTGT